MTKRESGWYRVNTGFGRRPSIAYYDSRICLWELNGDWRVLPENWSADKKMVMTPSGDIVYHNQPTQRALDAVERYNDPETWYVSEHDPLYNTKQEG